VEAYGEEDKFGNENQNFNKPNTMNILPCQTLNFKEFAYMHKSSKLINMMNMLTCNSIYKQYGN